MRTLSTALVSFVALACASSGAGSGPEEPAAPLGEPSDDVDPELIGAAVRQNAGQFQVCYEAGRERNPELAGRLAIRFRINPDGSVGQATLVETSLPAQVSSCILNAFYNVRLPRQEASVIAEYPMFFEPS